jgi:hypothetical protein
MRRTVNLSLWEHAHQKCCPKYLSLAKYILHSCEYLTEGKVYNLVVTEEGPIMRTVVMA